MTNIKEGNKLIAEWMYPEMLDKDKIEKEGIEITGNMFIKSCLFMKDYKRMNYHESWNSLMVVVDKIEKIEIKYKYGIDYYDFHIMPDAVIVYRQLDEDNPLILINKSDGKGKIENKPYLFENKLEAVYNAVVIFIKWYSKQNK